MTLELNAISIGARAARLLDAHAEWTVAALFERSFYLRSSNAFICVGDTSIGNGPLNVLVSQRPLTRPGATCRVARAAAQIWRQPPLAITAAGALDPEHLAQIISAALAVAPRESAIHLLGRAVPSDALAVRLHHGIGECRKAVTTGTGLDGAVSALAGLGLGLTPSGDDILAGALLMLGALHRTEILKPFAEAVLRLAPSRTSPLSFALLAPACDGEANAVTATALGAILDGQGAGEVVNLLSTVGATSGFDILAGMMIASGA